MGYYFKILTGIVAILLSMQTTACSILYYIDKKNGKIYFVNNEDYWYDVKPYLQMIPSTKNEFGRVWYGWDNFGQGGINEKGLVLDGAVTPLQQIPKGYSDPKKGNITDEILANCATVDEAIAFLENKKIALTNAHIFFGDRSGNAKIVEWVDGRRQIVEINNNRLIATNFNLSDTANHDTKCWRYPLMQKGLDELDTKESVDLKTVGNVMAKAVQPPQKDSSGKVGGTLYTSFIDLTEMKLILVYKLDNAKIYKFDILSDLQEGKKRKVNLD